MSEKSIAEALQDTFQALETYENADVVINDWSILNRSFLCAPFIHIETAGEFEARKDTYNDQTTWNIPVTLLVRYKNNEDAYNDFRKYRQEILNTMNTDGNRSAGLNAVTIDIIYSDGGIDGVFNKEVQNPEYAIPDLIAQRMIFVAEEF